MRKAILFAALGAFSLLAFSPAVGATPGKTSSDEASVRVFLLKYKRVEEAALLIRPHLSDAASVTLIQKLNAMTIEPRIRSHCTDIGEVGGGSYSIMLGCVQMEMDAKRKIGE